MGQRKILDIPSGGSPAGIKMEAWTDDDYGLLIKVAEKEWVIPQDVILGRVADFVRASRIGDIEGSTDAGLLGLEEDSTVFVDIWRTGQ